MGEMERKWIGQAVGKIKRKKTNTPCFRIQLRRISEESRRNMLIVLSALTDTLTIPQGLERNEAVCKLGFHCAQACLTI